MTSDKVPAGRLKIECAERAALKPNFLNEWINEKNILGFKLCAEAEKNFQTPWVPVQLFQHGHQGENLTKEQNSNYRVSTTQPTEMSATMR